MGSTKTKPHIEKQAAEDNTFWQQHIAAQASSGTSKLAYCHANQVDYARFIYWSRKKLSTKSLIAVKLSSFRDEVAHTPCLCTLLLKSGYQLQIHDIRALSVILERLN